LLFIKNWNVFKKTGALILVIPLLFIPFNLVKKKYKN